MEQRDESASTIQAMQRLFWFPNKDTQNSIEEGKEFHLNFDISYFELFKFIHLILTVSISFNIISD